MQPEFCLESGTRKFAKKHHSDPRHNFKFYFFKFGLIWQETFE